MRDPGTGAGAEARRRGTAVGGGGEKEGGYSASLPADTFNPFALPPLPFPRAAVAAASHGARALFVRTENGLKTGIGDSVGSQSPISTRQAWALNRAHATAGRCRAEK